MTQILLLGWTSIPKADDDDGYGDVDDDDIPASPLLRATPQESNSRWQEIRGWGMIMDKLVMMIMT